MHEFEEYSPFSGDREEQRFVPRNLRECAPEQQILAHEMLLFAMKERRTPEGIVEYYVSTVNQYKMLANVADFAGDPDMERLTDQPEEFYDQLLVDGPVILEVTFPEHAEKLRSTWDAMVNDPNSAIVARYEVSNENPEPVKNPYLSIVNN